VVILDKREGEVHAGRGTSGRGDVSVADEDSVGGDVDAGMAPGQVGAERPMGRCGSAVEQARASEQERAGADRARAACAVGYALDGRAKKGVGGDLVKAHASADDQRVNAARPDVSERSIRMQADAR
jgi:hypothetical protein